MNSYGQLGLGDTNERNMQNISVVKAFEKNVKEVDEVCIGYHHTLLMTVKRRKVYSVGRSVHGAISRGFFQHSTGNGKKVLEYVTKFDSVKLDTTVVGQSFEFEKIAAGAYNSYFVTSIGLFIAGTNNEGQLLNGLSREIGVTKQCIGKIVPPKYFNNDKVVDVCAGQGNVVILTKTGDFYFGGADNADSAGASVVGVNMASIFAVPIRMDFFSNQGISIVSITLSWDSVYYLSDRNELFVRGCNKYGQLGITSEGSANIKTPLLSPLKDVKQVLPYSWEYVVYETVDGTLWGIGKNDAANQRFGLSPSVGIQITPRKIPLPLPASQWEYAQFHSSVINTVAISSNGKAEEIVAAGFIFGEGLQRRGRVEIAQSDVYPAREVRKTLHGNVALPKKKKTLFFTGWGYHLFFVENTLGNLMGAGSNTFGQLALGNSSEAEWVPQHTILKLAFVGTETIKDVAIGSEHTIFLTNRRCYSCGVGKNGALSCGIKPEDEDENENETCYQAIGMPVEFEGRNGRSDVEKVVKIAAGPRNSFFVTSLGHVYGAGQNAFGVLGVGDNSQKNKAVLLSSFRKFGIRIISVLANVRMSVFVTAEAEFYVAGFLNSKIISGLIKDGVPATYVPVKVNHFEDRSVDIVDVSVSDQNVFFVTAEKTCYVVSCDQYDGNSVTRNGSIYLDKEFVGVSQVYNFTMLSSVHRRTTAEQQSGMEKELIHEFFNDGSEVILDRSFNPTSMNQQGGANFNRLGVQKIQDIPTNVDLNLDFHAGLSNSFIVDVATGEIYGCGCNLRGHLMCKALNTNIRKFSRLGTRYKVLKVGEVPKLACNVLTQQDIVPQISGSWFGEVYSKRLESIVNDTAPTDFTLRVEGPTTKSFSCLHSIVKVASYCLEIMNTKAGGSFTMSESSSLINRKCFSSIFRTLFGEFCDETKSVKVMVQLYVFLHSLQLKKYEFVLLKMIEGFPISYLVELFNVGVRKLETSSVGGEDDGSDLDLDDAEDEEEEEQLLHVESPFNLAILSGLRNYWSVANCVPFEERLQRSERNDLIWKFVVDQRSERGETRTFDEWWKITYFDVIPNEDRMKLSSFRSVYLHNLLVLYDDRDVSHNYLIVTVDERGIKCHKEIILAESGYLWKIITFGGRETRKEGHLLLQEERFDEMSLLVEYAYRKEVTLNENNLFPAFRLLFMVHSSEPSFANYVTESLFKVSGALAQANAAKFLQTVEQSFGYLFCEEYSKYEMDLANKFISMWLQLGVDAKGLKAAFLKSYHEKKDEDDDDIVSDDFGLLEDGEPLDVMSEVSMFDEKLKESKIIKDLRKQLEESEIGRKKVMKKMKKMEKKMKKLSKRFERKKKRRKKNDDTDVSSARESSSDDD